MKAILIAPARITNVLLLAITAGLAVLLGMAIGQAPTIILGLVTVVTFLLALRALSREVPVLAAIGSALTLFTAVLVVITVILAAWLAYRATPPDAVGVPNAMLSLLIAFTPTLLIGAVICVIQITTREFKRQRVRAALVSLLYGWVVLVGTIVVFLALNLGLFALVGGRAGETVGPAQRIFRSVERYNEFTMLATLSLLSAVVASLGIRITRLKRYVQFSSFVRSVIVRSGQGENNSNGNTTEPDPEESDNAVRARTEDVLPRLRSMIRRVPTLCGILGVVFTVIALAPRSNDTVREAMPTELEPIGPILGGLATAGRLRAVLLWAAVMLVVLRIAHVVLNWVIHFPWKRYQRRITRSAGGFLVAVGTVLFGPVIIRAVLRTTPFQYVYVFPGGRVALFEDGGIRVISVWDAKSGLVHAPDLFERTVRGIVDLVGPTPFLLAPAVGALIVGALTMVFSWYVLRPMAASISSPAILTGWLLFGSALCGAVLNVNTGLVLATGFGAVLVWDLQGLTRSLAVQLDSSAKTTRGELFRAGGTVIIAALAVVITLAGREAIRSLETLEATAPWQLLIGLGCSVFGTTLALIYLSYRNQ
jgi:hypothetical protein